MVDRHPNGKKIPSHDIELSDRARGRCRCFKYFEKRVCFSDRWIENKFNVGLDH